MTTTQQATDNPPPRSARLAVTTLFVLHGLVFASWVVRIPDIKARLQLTDAQLGLALLGAPVGVFAGQFLVGWLLPRLGSRRICTLMGLAWCVTFPLLGLTPNVLVLVVLLGLYGLLGGGMDVAMNAQAAMVEGRYGRPIMAGFHGMWSAAGLVGAALGGFLAGRGIAVELHFLIVALVALVAVLAASQGLLVERQPPVAEAPSLALLPRALLPLGALAFAVLLCEGAIGDWSAVYLRDNLGGSPGVAASGYVVFALMMTAGRLTGDWLTARLGPALIVRGGGLLVVAGMGLILLAQAPLVAVAGFGLVGAGVACPFPLVISAVARTPNIVTGRAIAAMATVAYSGSFLGPPVIGSLADMITLRGALGLLGVVGVIMLLMGGRVQQPAPSAPRLDPGEAAAQ